MNVPGPAASELKLKANVPPDPAAGELELKVNVPAEPTAGALELNAKAPPVPKTVFEDMIEKNGVDQFMFGPPPGVTKRH